MNDPKRRSLPQSQRFISERMRFALYGLIAGLLVGAFLGWTFHELFGVVFRLIISLVILIPLALALMFWLKVNQQNARERSDVQEADWRDLNDPR